MDVWYRTVSIMAVFACMTVQSLGSCFSAPTHHWMNIRLVLPSLCAGWGVRNAVALEWLSQSLRWIHMFILESIAGLKY